MTRRYTYEDCVKSFWSKVDKTETCWLWTGGTNGKGGYGRLRVLGKKTAAHIFSYQLHFIDYSDTYHVCHTCDNTKCVNPDHLFLGNRQDNMQDKHKKNRGVINKITPEQAREIIVLWEQGLDGPTIGKLYGISKQQVYNIKNKKSWYYLESSK